MRRIGAPLLAGLLAVLGLAPAAGAYEEASVADGGTLAGNVKYSGAPPSLDPLRVNKNRDVCGDQKVSEALVVGAGRGVRGSVVMINGITRGKKAGAEVMLDNSGCLFVPHVVGVMAGGRARIRNSDAMLHNTHGLLAGRTVFNLALPVKDQAVEITKRLSKPGVVRVLCDAHPHMFAWMVVHDSPYVTVTDERGAFRIDQVPPGAYTVTMWHEGFRQTGADKDGRPIYDEPRTVTKNVTIPVKGSVTVEFDLK
ncbi:MAG: carboxypeptidase regulatory-like domain-containing protein [Candidatus Rokubacteria bacterium]|nr:carboxypeptidase regulatory-like domain-containing protein [Candidatus Rokubacteria bacterium]